MELTETLTDRRIPVRDSVVTVVDCSVRQWCSPGDPGRVVLPRATLREINDVTLELEKAIRRWTIPTGRKTGGSSLVGIAVLRRRPMIVPFAVVNASPSTDLVLGCFNAVLSSSEGNPRLYRCISAPGLGCEISPGCRHLRLRPGFGQRPLSLK